MDNPEFTYFFIIIILTITKLLFFLVSSHNLTISGVGTTEVYQQALISIVYFNSAPEPTPSLSRRVQFLVFDGTFSSNPIAGSISIRHVNDNPVVLSCGLGLFNFTEGSMEALSIGLGVSLMDRDVNHVLSSVSVVLESRYQGDFISVESAAVADGITLSANESDIRLAGSATATSYQVRGGHLLAPS